MVGRLKKVPLREVWKHEEKDFTPWLSENLDVLGETLGMELSLVDKEAGVGESYEADLLLEGPNGDLIVVENQFGRSDHDHLGKILTYLSNLEAKKAIWICERPQPEHKAAVEWLNKNSPADVSFYVLKIEAIQIDDSQPAPQLLIETEPSAQLKEAGEIKGDFVERHERRLEFWAQLLEASKKKTQLFQNIGPKKDHWLSAGAGISGVVWQYLILKQGSRVQFNIESSDASKNKKIFDELFKHKDEVEAVFGDKLEWERLDERISSRVGKQVTSKGLRDVDDWSEIIDKMVDAIVRLEKALNKHVKEIRI
jgi:hypothetical protein